MAKSLYPIPHFGMTPLHYQKLISIISSLLTGKKANQSDPHLRMRDETVKRFHFGGWMFEQTEFPAMADIVSMMN